MLLLELLSKGRLLCNNNHINNNLLCNKDSLFKVLHCLVMLMKENFPLKFYVVLVELKELL